MDQLIEMATGAGRRVDHQRQQRPGGAAPAPVQVMPLEVEAVLAAVVEQLAPFDLVDAVQQQAVAAMVAEHRSFAQAGLEHHHVLHVQAGFQVVAGGHPLQQRIAAGHAAQLGKLCGQVFLQVGGVKVEPAGFNPGQQQ